MEVFQGEWPCRVWGQIFGAIAQDVLVRAHALGEVRIDLPDGRFRDTGEWVPTYETTGEHLFSTLGDTLCTVLGLVQSFLVTSFQRALQVRKGRSHVDQLYPVVALQDLHQEAIMVPLGHLERVFGKTYTEEERTFANSLMDADRRDYLIRATAFQAGIRALTTTFTKSLGWVWCSISKFFVEMSACLFSKCHWIPTKPRRRIVGHCQRKLCTSVLPRPNSSLNPATRISIRLFQPSFTKRPDSTFLPRLALFTATGCRMSRMAR